MEKDYKGGLLDEHPGAQVGFRVHAIGIVIMLSIPLLFPGAPPAFFFFVHSLGLGVPPSPPGLLES